MDRHTLASVFAHARREACFVVCVWLLALVWTVGYSYLRGYEHPPESWLVRAGLARAEAEPPHEGLWGVPRWVCVGILLPWAACTVATIWFCLGVMQDDPLGTDLDEEPADGH